MRNFTKYTQYHKALANVTIEPTRLRAVGCGEVTTY